MKDSLITNPAMQQEQTTGYVDQKWNIRLEILCPSLKHNTGFVDTNKQGQVNRASLNVYWN